LTKSIPVENNSFNYFTAPNIPSLHKGRRSKFEIRIDILDAISKGNYKPTNIMFRANLSWLVMKEAISDLRSSGLISLRLDRGASRYTLTEKGLVVLNDYTRLRREVTSVIK